MCTKSRTVLTWVNYSTTFKCQPQKNKLPLFTSTSQKNIAGLILTANRRSMNSLMFCDLVHLKLNEQFF